MVAYYLKLYGVTLVAFLAIDMIWLGLIAPTFYRKHLGHLLAPSPNWSAAIVFYLLFVAGLLVFVLIPGLKGGSLPKSLLLAGFFGLVTFATYDLTNLATIKDWPLLISVVDMLWGAALSVLVIWISFSVGKWLA